MDGLFSPIRSKQFTASGSSNVLGVRSAFAADESRAMCESGHVSASPVQQPKRMWRDASLSPHINMSAGSGGSPFAREIMLLREPSHSVAVVVPSHSLSDSGSYSSLRRGRPPMISFVTRYRRTVASYAAQNEQRVGLHSSVNTQSLSVPRARLWSGSHGDAMPLQVQCVQQCEEERVIRNAWSSPTRTLEPPISSEFNKRCALSVNASPLVEKRASGNQISFSLASSLSPAQVADMYDVFPRVVKRPVPLRRRCFDCSDSDDSSLATP
ncbi:hypothetical protein DQ04_07631020 [Trypanosoma grayi]|uniref:hypothetical protein n=1 Tax=Trypanosoma grayi TaxID=71804 RepID=UPI0004F4431C|nr:hypothetical protein DQ04_07631020 [Trypanosoma grayi]KEG08249.1 hypothetical protein DQ04_07631020 [Trypanosoma grayi]